MLSCTEKNDVIKKQLSCLPQTKLNSVQLTIRVLLSHLSPLDCSV